QLEAVAVAVGGGPSRAQGAVHEGDAVLDGHRADGAGVGLGEEVPAVVDVVVGDAAAEDVPGAGGQLGREAVGVLAVVRVEVVEGGAVQNEVVGRPFALGGAG